MSELYVGKEVAAWTYNECNLCGTVYPVSRCSVKLIKESDLVCESCWEQQIDGENQDQITSLTEALAKAKNDIEDLSLRNELLVKLSYKANGDLRQEVDVRRVDMIVLTNTLKNAYLELSKDPTFYGLPLEREIENLLAKHQPSND